MVDLPAVDHSFLLVAEADGLRASLVVSLTRGAISLNQLKLDSLLFSSEKSRSFFDSAGKSRRGAALRFQCVMHGNPDGHSGTQGLLRSLSPGRFGYSTFAYPVPYNYKPDERISLSRPYHSSFERILPLSESRTRPIEGR